MKHRLGITLGDPNGIGIEIFLKSLSNLIKFENVNFKIFGSRKTIEFYVSIFKSKFQLSGLLDFSSNNKIIYNDFEFEFLEVDQEDYLPEPGIVSRAAGRISYASVKKAVSDLKREAIEGVVTLPISKKSIQLAECPFTGHTTILQNEFNVKPVMCFLSPEMKVILVTIHQPLSKIPGILTSDSVIYSVEKTRDFFKKHNGDPRFLCLGLNPHAGEEGVLGKEDQEIITPAVNRLKEMSVKITGPVPPDSAFSRENRKTTDIFVALYHDQGLIPLKTLSFFNSCQLSIGFPFIRTSVSHGTAFEIAGQGKAKPDSFIYACKKAIEFLK